MQLYELFLIAVGLSMDAFAVSIGKGLTMKRVRLRDAALIGLWFGGFQCLMPLIGAFLGSRFITRIQAVDHWVAFGILAAVGANMIREAFAEDKEIKEGSPAKTEKGADLRVGTMLLLAVATSIDALAVGITLGLLRVRIVSAAVFIGCVTFCFSFGGVYAGRLVGTRFRKGASIAGGVVLILIGTKILLEHTGILA